jgi:hypothetical protein
LTLKTLSVLLSLSDQGLVIDLKTLEHLPQFQNLLLKTDVVLSILLKNVGVDFKLEDWLPKVAKSLAKLFSEQLSFVALLQVVELTNLELIGLEF